MSRGCPGASVTLIPGDTDNIFLGLEQGSLEISDIRIDCKNVNIHICEMVASTDLAEQTPKKIAKDKLKEKAEDKNYED